MAARRSDAIKVNVSPVVKGVLRARRPIGLPIYLAVMTMAQAALYLVGPQVNPDVAPYFDPRIGIYVLCDAYGEAGWPLPMSWISVAWLGAVAVTLLMNKVTLRFYLISEAVLSLPSVLFFSLVLIVNMSPAHGFSVPELLFPGLVFMVFSVIPFVWAIILIRRPKVPTRLQMFTTQDTTSFDGGPPDEEQATRQTKRLADGAGR